MRHSAALPVASRRAMSTLQQSAPLKKKETEIEATVRKAREQAKLGGGARTPSSRDYTQSDISLFLSLLSVVGQARLDKQHEKGKLTARERIDLLLDEGCGSRLSFVG
jgi:hypothetical protein